MRALEIKLQLLVVLLQSSFYLKQRKSIQKSLLKALLCKKESFRNFKVIIKLDVALFNQ